MSQIPSNRDHDDHHPFYTQYAESYPKPDLTTEYLGRAAALTLRGYGLPKAGERKGHEPDMGIDPYTYAVLQAKDSVPIPSFGLFGPFRESSSLGLLVLMSLCFLRHIYTGGIWYEDLRKTSADEALPYQNENLPHETYLETWSNDPKPTCKQLKPYLEPPQLGPQTNTKKSLWPCTLLVPESDSNSLVAGVI